MVQRAERKLHLYESAYLFFTCGMRQSEIAKRYGKNKATVSRWIGDAIECGMVTISVNPPGIDAIEFRLRETFGLRHAHVIPGLPAEEGPLDGKDPLQPDDRELLQSEQLGKAAAIFIGPLLQGNMGIGVGGGTKVRAFARNLEHNCPKVALDFYSLGISSREPFTLSATTLTALAVNSVEHSFHCRTVARPRPRTNPPEVPRIEGHALRLPSSSAENESFLAAADQYYNEAMEQVSVIVAGLGAIDTCWVLTAEERQTLKKQGALGDILFDVFGERGTHMQCEPSASVYAFGIDRLRRMVSAKKQVFVICAGQGKREVLYHALSSPEAFVTGVVTDQPTAEAVLAEHAARTT